MTVHQIVGLKLGAYVVDLKTLQQTHIAKQKKLCQFPDSKL